MVKWTTGLIPGEQSISFKQIPTLKKQVLTIDEVINNQALIQNIDII